MSPLQLEAYLLTMLVEGIAALPLARLFGVISWRASVSAILASAISHPIFWWAAYATFGYLGPYTTPALEGLVVLFESAFYRMLATKSWPRALALSALVNFASWLAGQIVFAFR
jgi:hypothetical protein